MSDQQIQADQAAQKPEATPADQGAQPEAQDSGRVFSQEDVNNLVAREVKKAQEKLLKQLGIEDFNSAKEGLQRFREWQESQKTEAERQAEQLQKLQEQSKSLADENEQLKAKLTAVQAGVRPDSIDDVVVLAKNYLGDGVDLNAAIKKVLEKYPHFAAAQQQQPEDKKPKFTIGDHKKADGLDPFVAALLKIGRASCRERVEISWIAGRMK